MRVTVGPPVKRHSRSYYGVSLVGRWWFAGPLSHDDWEVLWFVINKRLVSVIHFTENLDARRRSSKEL